MLKKFIIVFLCLVSYSIYSIDNVLVDELEYLGASEESWIAAGIRDSVIKDLSSIAGKYNFNIITVKEQTDAMQSLNERRMSGEKINLTKELEKLLNVKYRCNGTIQNSKGVIRVTMKILELLKKSIYFKSLILIFRFHSAHAI